MPKIKAVSLWQPWASLVANGCKKVETRSWKFPGKLPCLLAIHAAKKWDGELARLCLSEPFLDAIDPHRRLIWNARVCPLPAGAVVCIGQLVECLPIVAKPKAGEKCVGFDDEGTLRVWHPLTFCGQHFHSGDGYKQLAEHEAAFGDYTPGRWAWVMKDMLRIQPIPLRGRQSVWDWDCPQEVIGYRADQGANGGPTGGRMTGG